MKNIVNYVINIVLIFAIAALAVAPLESPITEKGLRWMSALEDDRAINELSIPGTHDSGATHSIADVAGNASPLPLRISFTSA